MFDQETYEGLYNTELEFNSLIPIEDVDEYWFRYVTGLVSDYRKLEESVEWLEYFSKEV